MISRNFAGKYVLASVLTMILVGIAVGQKTDETKPVTTAANANPQTVDARQSGTWSVGIDPSRNAVRVESSESDPVAVKVTNNRRPFQVRIIVTPTGLGNTSASLPIPAGKRLVIENVSAVGRVPAGMRMEMNFFTYFDNDGDGINDPEDLVFSRVALIEQGTFDDTTILAANHKVLVFADGTIGTTNQFITLIARLNGTTTGFAQGQLTISGYLEDLPVQ